MKCIMHAHCCKIIDPTSRKSKCTKDDVENNCMKLWETKYAFSYHQSIAMKHKETCECLGFPKVADFTD